MFKVLDRFILVRFTNILRYTLAYTMNFASWVGDMSTDEGGMAKKLFNALSGVPLRMISYGGSTHNISVLTDSSNKLKALQTINEGLFGLKGEKLQKA